MRGRAAERRELQRDPLLGALLTKDRAEIESAIDALTVPGDVPATLDALLRLNKVLTVVIVHLLNREHR